MINFEAKEKEYRYERKFAVSEFSVWEAEKFIRYHPFLFSEIYHERQINNMYFDSVNMTDYFDNIYGYPFRKKIRLRWYGDLFGKIENSSLELKIKKGLLGTKQAYRFPPFFMDGSFTVRTFLTAVEKSGLSESLRQQLKSLKPVLLNQYCRKYFLSADKNYRITLDFDFKFFRVNNVNNSFFHKIDHRHGVVLELKYNQNMGDSAERITNYFPFRVTRSSKYITGVESLS